MTAYMQSALYAVEPVVLVSSWLTSSRNSNSIPHREFGHRMRERKEKYAVLANKLPYLRNSARYDQGY